MKVVQIAVTNFLEFLVVFNAAHVLTESVRSMLKIGFDIGGVISKYPTVFRKLIRFAPDFWKIYIVTDQHPKDEVNKILFENNINIAYSEIYCADYEKYGNMAKAVLIKELAIDIFIDDFDAYLQWDSSLGPQPILLKVMADAYKPYWADSWKTAEGSDFGRRKYSNA